MKKQIVWVVVCQVSTLISKNYWEVTRFEKRIEPQTNQRGYNAEMAEAWFQRNNPGVKVIKVTVEKT